MTFLHLIGGLPNDIFASIDHQSVHASVYIIYLSMCHAYWNKNKVKIENVNLDYLNRKLSITLVPKAWPDSLRFLVLAGPKYLYRSIILHRARLTCVRWNTVIEYNLLDVSEDDGHRFDLEFDRGTYYYDVSY